MKHFIYILKCPTSNDIRYVGQSIDPNVRYRRHICESKRNKNKGHKYDWINSLLNNNLKPVLEIIKECDSENIDMWEKFYIKEFAKLFDLTNCKEGGRSNNLLTDEIKNEIKEKIRNTLKGRKPSANAAIAFIAYKSIKIDCYKNGQLVGSFNSLKECAKLLGLNRSKISMVLNGIRPHHKGYKFKRSD